MHDSRRVRRTQCVADRLEIAERLCGGQPPAPLDDVRQARSFEQLHHEVRPFVGQLSELVDVDDVGVTDAIDDARFADEALDHLRRRGELAVQHLDRRLAPQNAVLGRVDRAASTGRDGAEDEVLAGPIAGRELAVQIDFVAGGLFWRPGGNRRRERFFHHPFNSPTERRFLEGT